MSQVLSFLTVFVAFSHEIKITKESKGTLLKIMSAMTYESNFSELQLWMFEQSTNLL